MDIQNEIKLLSRISKRFRKSKKAKSKWPVDFQLRVLKLIELGLSPHVLTQKLNIPVQTFYSWRRFWRKQPKKNLKFLEFPISDKLENSDVDKKEVIHITLVKGASVNVSREVFEDWLARGLV